MNIDQWLQCIRVCCVNGIMMLLMWDHLLIGSCLWDHVFMGTMFMGSCIYYLDGLDHVLDWDYARGHIPA